MKRFGGFLIESGQITVNQLAQILIEQINNTPPSVEILYRESYLQAWQVLEILSVQRDENLDFPTACIKLQYWREDFSFIIKRETAKARPKLGQLMIDKGWIEPQQMMAQLMNYKAHCERLQRDENLTTLVAVEETVVAAGSEQLTELEFAPVFGVIEADNIPDYQQLFCEDKKNNMKLLILSLESMADADSNTVYRALNAFCGEYNSLKAAARSVGAALTEKLILQSEEILIFFKRFAINIEREDFSNLAAISLSVLDLLWRLREQIVECASEEFFWLKNSSRKEYMVLISKMQQMLLQMDSRGLQCSPADCRDIS